MKNLKARDILKAKNLKVIAMEMEYLKAIPMNKCKKLAKIYINFMISYNMQGIANVQ